MEASRERGSGPGTSPVKNNLADVPSVRHPSRLADSSGYVVPYPASARASSSGSSLMQESSASDRAACSAWESWCGRGASLLSGVGLAVGSGASVLFGPAVGPSVGVGSGVDTGVDPASSVGVFAGSGVAAAMLAGAVVSVGSGAGVAPVQAIIAASVNRSRAMTGRRGFGIDGVHPSVRSTIHSTGHLCLFSPSCCHRPVGVTCRSRYLNLVYPEPERLE